jgi:hypothetical protein
VLLPVSEVKLSGELAGFFEAQPTATIRAATRETIERIENSFVR